MRRPGIVIAGALVLVALLAGLGLGSLTTPSAPAAKLPRPVAAEAVVPLPSGALPPALTVRELGATPKPTPKPKQSTSSAGSSPDTGRTSVVTPPPGSQPDPTSVPDPGPDPNPGDYGGDDGGSSG